MNYSNLRRRILLVLASLLFATILGELMVRALGLGTASPERLINDRIVVGKPHHRFWTRLETNNWVELNNFGFHDIDREPVSAKHRLLVIGDSFVEGLQVPRKSTFPMRMEELFKKSGVETIEVMNAGRSGLSNAGEYALWREYVDQHLRLQYHHVLLAIYIGNDIEANIPRTSFTAPNYTWFLDSNGMTFLQRTPESTLKKAVRCVRSHSALAQTVYQNLYRIRRQRAEKAASSHAAPDAPQGTEADEELQRAAAATLLLLERWFVELRDRGIRFDVVVIPNPNRKETALEAFLEKLHSSADRLGFGALVLDLDRDPDKHFFRTSESFGHFNPMGHAEAADQIFQWLTNRYPELRSQPRH